VSAKKGSAEVGFEGAGGGRLAAADCLNAGPRRAGAAGR
jgi:hypothetical protein